LLVALVPAGVVTVMSTVRPAVPGGLGAEMKVSLPDEKKQGPGWGPHGESVVDPKATCVAPVKPLPRICTSVPPAADPVRGLTPLTTGGPGVS
jgi:hypothetical protein